MASVLELVFLEELDFLWLDLSFDTFLPARVPLLFFVLATFLGVAVFRFAAGLSEEACRDLDFFFAVSASVSASFFPERLGRRSLASESISCRIARTRLPWGEA